MVDEQPALEDVRSALVSIVQDGLKSRPDGVHLTYVGAEFARRMNAPFEQYLNVLAVQKQVDVPFSCRKMAPFLERYCLDVFDLLKNANGSILLRTKEQVTDADDVFVQSGTYHRFKKAVFVAFIRPLKDEVRRFLNLDTLGFTDAKRKPAGEPWLEIPRAYITETPLDQPIDGAAVQSKMSAWMKENNLDISVFLDAAYKPDSASSLDDLIRVIHSLPREVCSRWNIPADVIRVLSSNR